MMNILIRLPAILIAASIWLLSSQSTLPQIKGIFGFDKFQHLFAYMVLAGTIGLWPSLKQWKTRRVLTLLAVIGITSAYGVIDEIHQSFVPGRNCNVWDWLADTIGAVLGAIIMRQISRRRSPNEAQTIGKIF
jgi:VanZ family protein